MYILYIKSDRRITKPMALFQEKQKENPEKGYFLDKIIYNRCNNCKVLTFLPFDFLTINRCIIKQYLTLDGITWENVYKQENY